MPRLVPKHPLSIRILHWVNFPTLGVMVWSGLLIYWAYEPQYTVSVGGLTVKFFPDGFYRALGLERGLALGMGYHFAFAWLFAVTGAAYVAATLATGEWRLLLPGRRTPVEAFHVVLHDLGLRKAPLPPAKFNAAQRVAYTGVVAMGGLSVLTGLAILKPVQLGWLTWALGGYQTARLTHFVLTLLYVAFFLVHVAQVAKAGWNNFRAMVAGYEVAADPEPRGATDARPQPTPNPPPPPPPSPPARPAEPAPNVGRMTRRAFAVLGGAGAAAAGGLWWLRSGPPDGNIPWPLRRVHRLNERVGRALFGPTRLAPEFPPAAAADPRRNGRHGEPAAVAADWVIAVDVPGRPTAAYTPAELLDKLPRVDSTTEFKCIEGWSQVVRWGGVRFADVARKYGWPVDGPYVALATPDLVYHVGLDMPSAVHPQTLLCDEMNGRPLELANGAPLRLVAPVKYGIKSIKWVGRIAFPADRPDDFWAERGYDWYAGL